MAQWKDSDNMASQNLFNTLLILTHYRRVVLAALGSGGIGALLIAYCLTPIYSSNAKIMPPTQTQPGLIALVGQLNMAPTNQVQSVKNPNELYIGLLQSRTIADKVIAALNLDQRFKTSARAETRKQLAAMSNIYSGKEGLINVTVENPNAPLAARIANQYVAELITLTKNIALNDATERRIFFEQQLQHAQQQLRNAELQFKGVQENSGMLSPENQMKIVISQLAQLKAALAHKEMQLAALHIGSTARNPAIIRINSEISGLKQQLADLERGSAHDSRLSMPTNKMPQGSLEYLRKFREVKYFETLFELIAKQYELAKITEASNYSIVQILDPAISADIKTKPRRLQLVIFGMAVGALFGAVAALLLNQLRRLRQGGHSPRWSRLKAAWQRQSDAF